MIRALSEKRNELDRDFQDLTGRDRVMYIFISRTLKV